jgi:tetratricopeptide (TPR) repeat protein
MGLQTAPARAQAGDQNAAIVQLMHSGRDAMQRGDLAGAETVFRRAIEAAPALSDCYLGLGLVQLRMGEMKDATKSLSRATELNPKLPGAHLFLGIAYYQMGQIELAVSSLREEIALAPTNTEALTWLGIMEIGAGRPEEATEPLDRAVALSPKDSNILYYRGRAHTLVAGDSFRQLSQLDPDSALVHRALAESFAESGRPEKAVAEYLSALVKQPGNPDLYEGLGDQDLRMSHVEDAAKAYEKELTFNPNSAIALYNLGRIEVEAEKLESGIALLRRASAAHALAAPTDFYLGLGLAGLGQNEEAANWLERSLVNYPSSFIEQSAYYQLVRVYQKLNKKTEAAHALEQLKRLKAEAALNISNPNQPASPSKSPEAGDQQPPQQL